MNRHCPDHALTHIRDALAHDDRVGELGLDVRRLTRDGREEIVIVGAVSTSERKAHVVEVANEIMAAEGFECVVVDDTQVATPNPPDPGAAETL